MKSQDDDESQLKKMKPHVPGIVIFADHSKPLPWSLTYHAVVMFADISGILMQIQSVKIFVMHFFSVT